MGVEGSHEASCVLHIPWTLDSVQGTKDVTQVTFKTNKVKFLWFTDLELCILFDRYFVG
jgi:hypothetical protein